MKNKKLFIRTGAAIGLVAAALVLFKIAHRDGGAGVSSGKTGKGKVLYYRAPMDPNYISDKPGKSPMGMDLVPVYEGEETKGAGIRIDPATVQNIGVRTDTVRRLDLARDLRTVGRIAYDERKIAYVNTKIGGWIEKLYVDYTGQAVEKGEKLLEIYSPELVSTQEEYLLALEYSKMLEKSKFDEVSNRAASLLESSKKRLQYWDITDEQIKHLAETGEVKKTLTLHSPTKGIVIHKNILEGTHTAPGQNLYRIADISRIWVYADVYEYELPWVKAGQDAEMSLSYLPGKVFKGKITYIYPYLEEKTRTIKVRMEFDNPGWELKPDMYANIKIETESRKAVLAAPTEAVIRSGERNIIVIDKGNGLFEPRDVELGLETKDYYEVAKGVEEGDKIVTSSQFLIDSESRLKEAISKMLEAKKPKSAEMEAMPHPREAMEIEDATRQVMENVWKHYFAIESKLSADSIAGIEQEARSIKEELKEILDSEGSAEMKSVGTKISESTDKLFAKDIVRLRDGFMNLSNAMIEYMKKFDRESSMAKKYRLLFCSMDEKYWVQDNDEINNPYLGKSMSSCGAPEDY